MDGVGVDRGEVDLRVRGGEACHADQLKGRPAHKVVRACHLCIDLGAACVTCGSEIGAQWTQKKSDGKLGGKLCTVRSSGARLKGNCPNIDLAVAHSRKYTLALKSPGMMTILSLACIFASVLCMFS